MTPTAWSEAHSFQEMASGHSSYCHLLYSDLFFIHNSERETFPTPKHQEGPERCLNAVLCLQARLTALGMGISSVPFAKREWCFLPQEATPGCAGLLGSRSYSSHARHGEVHLAVAMLVKGFIFVLVFSLNKGNLIFHYFRHVAFKSVL